MKKNHSKSYLIFFAVLLVLAVGAFFMVNVQMPAWAYVVSGINIVLFAAPSIWTSIRWLGRRDGLTLFLYLGLYALVIESFAVTTGFPYGHFAYSDLLGYQLFGAVPWTVAFAWTPLILAAYTVSRRLLADLWQRLFATAAILLLFDLVLDPGAVFLGFWTYADGGLYYGVPLMNFAGWIISGLVGAGIIEIILGRFEPLLPAPAQMILSAYFTIIFWTLIAFWSGMIVPFLIGIGLTGALSWFYLRFYYAFDEMIVLVDENNNPLATAPKLAAHHRETPLHRAFSIFIFNRKGEVLVQQRAKNKKTWAGSWSNSCCGHLMLHEKLKDGAARRLRYELGLKNIELSIILPDFQYRAEKDGIVENEICPVLVGFTDQQPILNPQEVADFKWLGWQMFLENISLSENGFSPWSKMEAELLSEDPQFEHLFNKNVI